MSKANLPSSVASVGSVEAIVEYNTGTSSYPARPTQSYGSVRFIGPVQPTGVWQTGDTWEPTYLTPRQVIIDTDWNTDPGDISALRIACYYEKQGAFDILAVICDTNAPANAPSIDGFLRNESRPIPVATTSQTWDDHPSTGTFQMAMLQNLNHWSGSYPDSVQMYRYQLANAPGKIDIICIGHLGALSGLMQSAADGISSQTGMQLITAKVRKLWVMGGQYPSGSEHNFNVTAKAQAGAYYVVTNWPTSIPLTFLGFEVGNTVKDYTTMPGRIPITDPLWQAYVTYPGYSSSGHGSWDEMLMMLAAIGDETAAGYTTVTGTNAVNSGTGANTFTAGAGGPHKYVVKTLTDAQYAASVDALLIPGQQAQLPSGLQVCDSSGVAQPVDRNNKWLGRFSTIVAGGPNPVPALVSQVIPTGTDGAASSSVTSTIGPNYVQATGAAQPTFRANIAGRACLQFSGSQYMLSSTGVGAGQFSTMYALVYLPEAPTGTVGILSDDQSHNGGGRTWGMELLAGGQTQAVDFVQGAGSTDSTLGVVPLNGWHLLTIRRSDTTLEAFIDLVSDGGTLRQPPDRGSNLINVGAEQPGGTLGGFTGYISEWRVYSGYHTTDTMKGIAEAMGFMAPPPVTDIAEAGEMLPQGFSQGSTITLVNNRLYLLRYVPKKSRWITGIAYSLNTASTGVNSANDAVDVGIYNITDANTLAIAASAGSSTGVLSGSTGGKSLTLSAPFFVTAGKVYYVGIAGTVNATAAKLDGVSWPTNIGSAGGTNYGQCLGDTPVPGGLPLAANSATVTRANGNASACPWLYLLGG